MTPLFARLTSYVLLATACCRGPLSLNCGLKGCELSHFKEHVRSQLFYRCRLRLMIKVITLVTYGRGWIKTREPFENTDAMKGHETVKRREKRARQVKVGHTSGSVHSGTLGRWFGFCSALLSHSIAGQVLGRARFHSISVTVRRVIKML